MQFHQLQRVHKNKKRMIVARGGKRGKTSGRGGKGQSARAGNKRRPEWRDIIKKLPKLRGRGVNSNKPITTGKFVVNLDIIEQLFSAGDAVTPTTLVEKGIVETYSGRIPSIKILGDGEITKAIKVTGCAISVSAAEKIVKAGGETPEFKFEKPGPKVEHKTASQIAYAKIKAPEAKKAPKKDSTKEVKVAKEPKTSKTEAKANKEPKVQKAPKSAPKK